METPAKEPSTSKPKELQLQEARPQQLQGRLLTLVTNFIAGIGLLAFLGYRIDKKLANTYYIVTLCGVLLGFVWGFYEIIKFVRSQEQENKNL